MRRVLLPVLACVLAWPGPAPGRGPQLVGAARAELAAVVNLGDRNASQLAGDQGEVSIAIDAEAPNRLAVAAMNVQDGRLLTMASSDGGDTWERTLLPLGPGAQLHADPMLAFDSRGVVHLAYIPVAAGNHPVGIDVVHSFDGGASWSSPLRISKATGRDDKVALTVDDGPESAFRDRVYVAWKWPSGGVFIASSSDGGQSFSRPRLADLARVSGLDLAVSAEGILYLGANAGPEHALRVLRSSDGGHSFAPAVTVAPVRATWYTRQPSHCDRLSLVHASIASDRSDGPRRGALYATWADYAEGGSDELCRDACASESTCVTRVYLSRSTDGGRTWSTAEPLPGQQPRSDRYLQWARTDRADGALYVAYKDTALDPLRFATDVYLSRSTDGGLSWDPPVRVSSASSDARGFGFQYGDYQGLAVAQGHVHPAWSDYRSDPAAADRNGEVYVGRLFFRADP